MADTNHGKITSELKEFSVIYTDRALNLMSAPFCKVMVDISADLKETYNAHSTVIIPGSGSYAMEACARQFGTGKKCLVIRNGYFSYRWSDIFAVCEIPAEEIVLKARAVEDCENPHFAPLPVDDIVANILESKPDVVFAPHVETATGMILPDSFVKAVADAVHSYGGLFVLDCIASGTIWVDMKALGIDVVISAPQKGWTGPAGVGICMLSEKAREACNTTKPTSFCVNLLRWAEAMEVYEAGKFKYYTTWPSDALSAFGACITETKRFGMEKSKDKLWELGSKIRAVLKEAGFKSVAADGFASPGVVVVYSPDPNMVGKFKEQGIQVAGGVPFMLDTPLATTFRVGLFGLDKIYDVDATVATFKDALSKIQVQKA